VSGAFGGTGPGSALLSRLDDLVRSRSAVRSATSRGVAVTPGVRSAASSRMRLVSDRSGRL